MPRRPEPAQLNDALPPAPLPAGLPAGLPNVVTTEVANSFVVSTRSVVVSIKSSSVNMGRDNSNKSTSRRLSEVHSSVIHVVKGAVRRGDPKGCMVRIRSGQARV